LRCSLALQLQPAATAKQYPRTRTAVQTKHPPHNTTSRPQVAAAKANFDYLFFYLKTSHTIEICCFTAEDANKEAVKANPVLFNLPESQCAKAISAVDDFETGAGKDLLSKCNSVVTEAPTDRGAE
jgi:hypothetical protein